MVNIIINNKTYHYKILTIFEFIIWLSKNKKIRKSIKQCLIKHRHQYFKFKDLINEYNKDKEKSNDTLFLFIYKNNEIITSCRFIYKDNKGYINMVHTNEKYRNQGFCYQNIKLLLELTSDLTNTNTLEVLRDNISAIKCYEKNNFKIIKELTYKNDRLYEMKFIK